MVHVALPLATYQSQIKRKSSMISGHVVFQILIEIEIINLKGLKSRSITLRLLFPLVTNRASTPHHSHCAQTNALVMAR